MGFEKRVMIIDDNIIDRMITSKILEVNYIYEEVMVMESASAALAYFDYHKNDSTKLPNLILLDLDMPSINGFGFLERFSNYSEAIKNACPIVVLTASDVKSDLQEMQLNPFVCKLISKPLDKHSLISLL